MDAEAIFNDVVKYYGYSKYQNTTPFIEIEDSPYSDADDPNLIGEYCNLSNSLTVYWKNIKSKEIVLIDMMIIKELYRGTGLLKNSRNL